MNKNIVLLISYLTNTMFHVYDPLLFFRNILFQLLMQKIIVLTTKCLLSSKSKLTHFWTLFGKRESKAYNFVPFTDCALLESREM